MSVTGLHAKDPVTNEKDTIRCLHEADTLEQTDVNLNNFFQINTKSQIIIESVKEGE